MKRVFLVAALAVFIGSGMFALAQEPVKKPDTENPAPADSTKQEAQVIVQDTVPATGLTASLF